MTAYPARLNEQERLQQFVTQLCADCKAPGISVAMNIRGATLTAAAGTADASSNAPLQTTTRFDVGGMGKFLLAIAAADLAAAGKLNLNMPVASYLPELSSENGNAISLRHLLSHTAGYQDDNFLDPDILFDYSWPEFVQSFKRRERLFVPGTVFDYSHSASVIVSKVIERVAGIGAGEFIRQQVLLPSTIAFATHADHLAIAHRFDIKLKQYIPTKPVVLCELWANSLFGPPVSPLEIAAVCVRLMAPGKCLEATAEHSLLEQVVALPTVANGGAHIERFATFGLGCGHYPDGSYGLSASDSGQTWALRLNPTKRIAIAVAINAHLPIVRDFIVKRLLAFIPQDTAVADNSLQHLSPQAFELAELTGIFLGAQYRSLHASLENDRLVLRPGHNPAVNQDADKFSLTMLKQQDGVIVPDGSPHNRHSVCGFFREPVTNIPCLMIGDNVLKKMLHASR